MVRLPPPWSPLLLCTCVQLHPQKAVLPLCAYAYVFQLCGIFLLMCHLISSLTRHVFSATVASEPRWHQTPAHGPDPPPTTILPPGEWNLAFCLEASMEHHRSPLTFAPACRSEVSCHSRLCIRISGHVWQSSAKVGGNLQHSAEAPGWNSKLHLYQG